MIGAKSRARKQIVNAVINGTRDQDQVKALNKLTQEEGKRRILMDPMVYAISLVQRDLKEHGVTADLRVRSVIESMKAVSNRLHFNASFLQGVGSVSLTIEHMVAFGMTTHHEIREAFTSTGPDGHGFHPLVQDEPGYQFNMLKGSGASLWLHRKKVRGAYKPISDKPPVALLSPSARELIMGIDTRLSSWSSVDFESFMLLMDTIETLNWHHQMLMESAAPESAFPLVSDHRLASLVSQDKISHRELLDTLPLLPAYNSHPELTLGVEKGADEFLWRVWETFKDIDQRAYALKIMMHVVKMNKDMEPSLIDLDELKALFSDFDMNTPSSLIAPLIVRDVENEDPSKFSAFWNSTVMRQHVFDQLPWTRC